MSEEKPKIIGIEIDVKKHRYTLIFDKPIDDLTMQDVAEIILGS